MQAKGVLFICCINSFSYIRIISVAELFKHSGSVCTRLLKYLLTDSNVEHQPSANIVMVCVSVFTLHLLNFPL